MRFSSRGVLTASRSKFDPLGAPYRAFRRPPTVGQGDGPVLLQHLPEYLAGLAFFHGRAVPNGVLPLVGHREYTFFAYVSGVDSRPPFRAGATCG